MRYVYNHQDAARNKGLLAAQEVKEKWTWNNSAEKIIERLDQISKQM